MSILVDLPRPTGRSLKSQTSEIPRVITKLDYTKPGVKPRR